MGNKRPSEEEGDKVSGKKSKFSKYGGLKFQSAGNLVTVGDKVHMEEAGKRGRGYQDRTTTGAEKAKGAESRESQPRPKSPCPERLSTKDRTQNLRTDERSKREGSAEDKFSFGFSKKAQKESSEPSVGEPKSKTEGPGDSPAPGMPPPLMSRRRELMEKAFGGDSDSEGEEEGAELVKMAVRGPPRFMFHIKK